MYKNALMALAVVVAATAAGEAQAALKTATFDQLQSTKDVGAVNDHEPVLVIGKINKGAEAIASYLITVTPSN